MRQHHLVKLRIYHPKLRVNLVIDAAMEKVTEVEDVTVL